jgi:hypothetical protein
MSKKTKLLAILFTVLTCLLNIGPFFAYAIVAYANCVLIHQKVALTMTVFVVLVMTIVSIVNKVAMKSRLWVVLIGLYVCL